METEASETTAGLLRFARNEWGSEQRT
jgi:hypothetical protein